MTPWGLYLARIAVMTLACLAIPLSITHRTITLGSVWMVPLGVVLAAICYRGDLVTRLATGAGETIDVSSLVRSRSFRAQVLWTVIVTGAIYMVISRFAAHQTFTAPGWIAFMLLLQLANARVQGWSWTKRSISRGSA